jgi:hypothetical protein
MPQGNKAGGSDRKTLLSERSLTYEFFFDALSGMPVGRTMATSGGARRGRNKPRRASVQLERQRDDGTRLRAWSKALGSSPREVATVGNDRRR